MCRRKFTAQNFLGKFGEIPANYP